MVYEKGGSDENKNWNNAKIYSLDKVMKPLTFYDKYIRIAHFGVENFEDSFGISEDLTNLARFNALKRLVKEIDIICRNSYALVKKNDKQKMLDFISVVKNCSDKVKDCAKHITNQRDNSQHLVINEEMFGKVLEIVESLHMQLIIPLNRAELIMGAEDEEVDIKDIREIQEEIFAVE